MVFPMGLGVTKRTGTDSCIISMVSLNVKATIDTVSPAQFPGFSGSEPYVKRRRRRIG
jgi:hypothetical protein